jgi:hypothetical protein
MDPITIITVVSSSMKLVEKLLPVIDDLFQSGQITAEQQQQVRSQYESLKTQSEGQFSQPHWQIEPDPDSPEG